MLRGKTVPTSCIIQNVKVGIFKIKAKMLNKWLSLNIIFGGREYNWDLSRNDCQKKKSSELC